ncbi:hypothetical protein [Roseinatronobacter sp.]
MHRATAAIAFAVTLSACLDAEISTRIYSNGKIDTVTTFYLTPQGFDFTNGGADMCENEWFFDGTVYVCTMGFSGNVDRVGTGDSAGDVELFSIHRIGRDSVSVALNLAFLASDPPSPDDAAMISTFVAGNAITITIHAREVLEHQRGTMIDDGSAVLWRIPLTWLLMDDRRLQDDRTATLRF